MMNPIASKVLKEALELPAEERAFLAELMLSSLDTPSQAIDQLWINEAEARIDAEKRGEMELISLRDVFAKYE